MIDIPPHIELFQTIIIITIVLAVFIILFLFVKMGNGRAIIGVGVAAILVIGVIVVYKVVADNIVNDIKTKISEIYQISIADDQLTIEDINNVSKGLPSKQLIGRLKGDNSRIYEVYLLRNNDNESKMSLYTRNEKGVYLPVTRISTEIASDNNSTNIIDNSDGGQTQNGESRQETEEKQKE